MLGRGSLDWEVVQGPEHWFWKEVGEEKKFFGIGWSDESECQACDKAEGTEKHNNMGSTIAQNGTRSEGRSQRPPVSVSKKRELQRRSGSGKEVLSRFLAVKANGTGVVSA